MSGYLLLSLQTFRATGQDPKTDWNVAISCEGRRVLVDADMSVRAGFGRSCARQPLGARRASGLSLRRLL
eukprot:6136134-Pleurochrysis_carterae.AAC.1